MSVLFSLEEIKKCIPHRPPFLLVDGITQINCDPNIINSTITGFKYIDKDNEVFKGHFPDYPIFPGVLIIEAMAQNIAVLLSKLNTGCTTPLLGRIKNSKFKLPVYPENKLILKGKIIKYRHPNVVTFVQALVNDKLVAEAELFCHFK